MALGLMFMQTCFAEQSYVVKHFQSQARYQFGHELLELALSKVDKKYTINAFDRYPINEARGEKMLINGDFDVQWLSTSAAREENLIPIKIPIYKGLLGLRLLLVKKQNKAKFSHIATVEDLRKYTGGHGSHWSDLSVYPANQLPVHTNSNYDSLFLQLANDRFDYFHRGLNEIWREYLKHKDKLEIADNVMLYYPHPVYYFVNKNKPELTNDIKKGLNIALNDGSYKALFFKQHGNNIEKGNLKSRTVITLVNPDIPKGTPKINTDWWLPKP